jgi:hypothetical protein
MPVNYNIIYNSSGTSPTCGSGSTVTVDLVQDAIVQYNSSNVEAIEIVYSENSGGGYPTGSFVLTLNNTTYEIDPIDPTAVSGTNPFTHSSTENATSYTVTFAPPSGTDEVLTLFDFGSESGPATKLSVKVRRKQDYSCP